jgi:hypothetical protein
VAGSAAPLGGISSIGSIAVAPVTVPAAPSIVSGFTAGTTDYYYCVAGDRNANTSNGLGLTPQSTSTGTTATTGTMSCPGVTGALKLYLLRAATPTLTNGAQSVQVAVCTTTSGVGCNLSDAANSPTSFFVQGTQGNGTNYIVAGSGIFSPALSNQDAINNFMLSGSTGNPIVNYSNGIPVSAISAKGQFFSQPTDTGTAEFQANGPSGQTANLLDLKVNSVSKFTVDHTGAITVGGGGGITIDPSLNTGTGVTGLSVTPQQFGAKGDGKICYDGAMTSGSSTLTSTCLTGTGDNGKLICVDGTSATTVTDITSTRHVERCGTVTTGASGSGTLSFTNASGGSITFKEVRVATNDTTAIQAAITSLATSGGTVFFPPATYGLNTTLTMPTTATVNLTGFGNTQRDSWLALFSDMNGDAVPLTLPTFGSNLAWLTTSMSSSAPGIKYSALGANKTVWWLNPVISNLTLMAGAGTGYDGGGGDGIAALDWWTLEIHGVTVTGFKGAGVLLDVLGTSQNDYVGQIDLYTTTLSENGYGMSLGRSGNAGSSFYQNTYLNGTDIENNLNDGVTLASDWHDLVMTNSTIQRNDSVNSASFADFNMTASCFGCTLSQNYLEADFSNEKIVVGFSTTGNKVSPSLYSNIFYCILGSNYAIYLGNDASDAQVGGVIDGNYFKGCAAGKGIVPASVQNLLVSGNTSDTETLDAVDYYNNAGVLSQFTTTTGASGVAPHPLATYTCNAAAEGAMARATNCGSVTLGTTCSGAGSTHATVACDGTNWKQVGY